MKNSLLAMAAVAALLAAVPASAQMMDRGEGGMASHAQMRHDMRMHRRMHMERRMMRHEMRGDRMRMHRRHMMH